jgi:hypothetical protein
MAGLARPLRWSSTAIPTPGAPADIGSSAPQHPSHRDGHIATWVSPHPPRVNPPSPDASSHQPRPHATRDSPAASADTFSDRAAASYGPQRSWRAGGCAPSARCFMILSDSLAVLSVHRPRQPAIGHHPPSPRCRAGWRRSAHRPPGQPVLPGRATAAEPRLQRARHRSCRMSRNCSRRTRNRARRAQNDRAGQAAHTEPLPAWRTLIRRVVVVKRKQQGDRQDRQHPTDDGPAD